MARCYIVPSSEFVRGTLFVMSDAEHASAADVRAVETHKKALRAAEQRALNSGAVLRHVEGYVQTHWKKL